MKKTVKLLGSILLIISICMSFSAVASAADAELLASDKYVITDGTEKGASKPIFKNGKVTFKVSISSGVTVKAAMITARYDKNVLKVIDAGAVTTKNSDGEETEVMVGLHTNDPSKYDANAYTFAYISADGFKTGNSGKDFVYITFEVIDPTYPATTVEFFNGDYQSTESVKKYENIQTLDTGVISSFSAGKKSITLKWNSVKGATEYRVYRKGGDVKNYELIATTASISYTDSLNIQNNTTYTYAIRAGKADNDGTKVYGWYIGEQYTYIDPVTLTLSRHTSGVKIAWNKIDGATGYRIYRREKGTSDWTKIKDFDEGTLTTIDTKVETGKNYEYTARTLYEVGSISSRSDTAEVKSILYVAPTSKVTLSNAYGGVSIKWNAVSGAEKYKVYRKVAGEKSWTSLGYVSGTSYTDKKASSGKTNYYTVRPYDDGVLSAYKSYSIVYLAAPEVTVTPKLGTGMQVKWKAVSGARSYRVYKYVNGKWKRIATVEGKSYTDKDVKKGKTYKYTVRAVNGKNVSGYNKSGVSSAYSLGKPSVSSISTTSKAITIKWGKVSGAEGYRVYRKNGSKWVRVATVKGTSYTDKNVKSGKEYLYTVRAYAGKTTSSYNKTGWVGVILKTPTVKIKNDHNGIKVSWNKISGAAGYTVYSSQYNVETGKWSSWKNRGTTKKSTYSWVDKKAESGQEYKYTVRAVNEKCKSTYKSSSSLYFIAEPDVSIINTSNGINVSWSQVAGVEGYIVYSSYYNTETEEWTSWKNRGTQDVNTLSWVDETAEDGVTYRYTVRAVCGKTKSAYSASNSLQYTVIVNELPAEAIALTEVL